MVKMFGGSDPWLVDEVLLQACETGHVPLATWAVETQVLLLPDGLE